MPRLFCVVFDGRRGFNPSRFDAQETSLICDLPPVYRAHVPIDSHLVEKTKERLTPVMLQILDGVYVRRMSLEKITKEIRATSPEKPVLADVELSFQVATGILREMVYADC